jgi:hypothetical protein
MSKSNIHQCINEILAVLQNRLKKQNIEVEQRFNSDAQEIIMDEHKMKQVFMNLFLNSIQAMPEGGKLRIASEYNQTEHQIIIHIEDTGCGISKDINWQGGGSFIYFELKKYNEAFIDKIQEAKTTDELLQIWEQMKDRSFLNYNVDIKKNDEHIEEFKQLTIKEQKEHLVELLNKNQLYVNLSSIDDKDFEVTEEEKKVTNDFYQINKG